MTGKFVYKNFGWVLVGELPVGSRNEEPIGPCVDVPPPRVFSVDLQSWGHELAHPIADTAAGDLALLGLSRVGAIADGHEAHLGDAGLQVLLAMKLGSSGAIKRAAAYSVPSSSTHTQPPAGSTTTPTPAALRSAAIRIWQWVVECSHH